MSSDANCEKLRAAGAELALGVLPGRERAEAIAHLDGCAECREYIRQLTGIGDRLIGLLPDREPPPGFETRVARSLAQQSAGPEGQRPARAAQGLRSRARRARLRLAAVGAALTVAVGFAGWGIGTAVQEITASAPAVGSEPVLVGDMTPAGGGQPVGEVYAHPGSPAWIFMSVALTGTPYTGKVTCLLERADGTTTRVGDFPLRDGRGNWGVVVPVDLTKYTGARLASPDGTVLATAQLQKGKVVAPET
ncbi:zf-HC2 domain-containing protein [Streptomyces sp. NPDC096040]|uniref:zf-HC2 domain-containing protein n=1 Tax=Streptomyces sp. NPDC096040 TaxID=3155541 RepID=UPI00331AC2A3